MSKKIFDRIITIILLLICVVLAAAIYLRLGSVSADSISGMKKGTELIDEIDATTQIINVSAQSVTSDTFIKTVTTGATVVNKTEKRALTSTQGGTVKQILVGEGDVIQIGDTICIVDPSKPGAQYKEVELKAIASGEIDELNIIVGQEITSGATLLTIKPAAELKIKAYLPEKYYSLIDHDTKATFTSEAYDGRIFQASITKKETLINTDDWTFGMEFETPADELIVEGMYVRISIEIMNIENAIAIPRKSINTLAQEKYVYVVENGVAIRRNITTGAENETSVVVTSGLDVGEMIITAGTVTDQSPVHII
ncbi:MAG: efflux RND transporter periplasmic adaptor subunit [Sphaerochaetaceae bacterium]